MKNICGINGFGRFGIHLLRFYLKNIKKNQYEIKYINDSKLSLVKIKKLIKNDPYIDLFKYDITLKKNSIIFFSSTNYRKEIFFSNIQTKKIKWFSSIDYFLECSGEKIEKIKFITKKHQNIKNIILSATSATADKTLIYGFNHNLYKARYKSISYGSCTVNAFVPLANLLNKIYKINDCDVNVIHNLPNYKILDKENYKLERRFCTLSSSAPKLLHFLNDKNFNVNYTLVPYSGPSIMDIRFRLEKKPRSLKSILTKITKKLKNVYDYDLVDRNSNNYKFIENNLKIIFSNSSIKKNNLYLFGYFDNENSVVRYNDILNHIVLVNSNAEEM
tara:strand:+ start:8676 stop:9671 length:996 start_codon:yes stop_codon:yes gene_type:complete